VTNYPEAPELSAGIDYLIKTISELKAAEEDGFTIAWSLESGQAADNFRIYLYYHLSDDDDILISDAGGILVNPDITTYTFNPLKYKTVLENSGRDIDGYYYARVTTELNGEESDPSDAPGDNIKKMFFVME
jgi:hypothetical protein